MMDDTRLMNVIDAIVTSEGSDKTEFQKVAIKTKLIDVAEEEALPKEKKKTSTIASSVLQQVASVKPDSHLTCSTRWLPDAYSLNMNLVTFIVVFIVVFIINSNQAIMKGNMQYLMVLPIIISFSGNIGVGALTRTLLIWNDFCFNNTRSKLLWLAQQLLRVVILGVFISLIATVFLLLMRFDMRVIISMLLTIMLTLFASTALGVIYPLVLKMVSDKAPEYAGNLLLITNDVLASVFFITFIKFVTRNDRLITRIIHSLGLQAFTRRR